MARVLNRLLRSRRRRRQTRFSTGTGRSASSTATARPYGLEQDFTVLKPQAGTGPLVLAMRVGGALLPEQVGSKVLFKTKAGLAALRYGQLDALDATGRRLPAQIQIRNGNLRLVIDTHNARYPLRIDPFFQQGEKLTGGGESAQGFGNSVALSADGNTALIGGASDNGEVGRLGCSCAPAQSGRSRVQSSLAAKRLGRSGAVLGLALRCRRTATRPWLEVPRWQFHGPHSRLCLGFRALWFNLGQEGPKLTGSGEMYGQQFALPWRCRPTAIPR